LRLDPPRPRLIESVVLAVAENDAIADTIAPATQPTRRIDMTNLTLKSTLVLLASLFVLGACGQKGPLYLPGSQNDPNVSAKPAVKANAAATDGAESSQETDQQDDNNQATE